MALDELAELAEAKLPRTVIYDRILSSFLSNQTVEMFWAENAFIRFVCILAIVWEMD